MESYTAVKDSGQRRQFDTGSQRDIRDGKGRYDLISPIFMQRFAVHMENGAKKYGDRNWELGQPLSCYFDCATRHLWKHLWGFRDEDHLMAAVFNIQGMVHTKWAIDAGLLPKHLDDLPDFTKNGANIRDPQRSETSS